MLWFSIFNMAKSVTWFRKLSIFHVDAHNVPIISKQLVENYIA